MINYSYINISIFDDDPIFRLGLSTALTEWGDQTVRILSQGNISATLIYLEKGLPQLVILSLNGKNLSMCQQIRQFYPLLPILILGDNVTQVQLSVIEDLGCQKYLAKGSNPQELMAVINEMLGSVSVVDYGWWGQQLSSGIKGIDQQLLYLEKVIQNNQTPLIDWLFIKGRKRELLTTRWLINSLLPKLNVVRYEPTGIVKANASLSEFKGGYSIFNELVTKLQNDLDNNLLLEINILKVNKKQELLYLITNGIVKMVEELKFLGINQEEELISRKDTVLLELWQSTSLEFLGRYCEEAQKKEVMSWVLNEALGIQQEILWKTPFVTCLFQYLLQENSEVLIDGVMYRHESPEAKQRISMILENLVIRVSNGVMQVVLNNPVKGSRINDTLYENKYKSSREMARFRNTLSWEYRRYKYWAEPSNIFEDSYNIYRINNGKIEKLLLRSNRTEELQKLQGIPWLVTIMVEARDAIAPVVKAVIAWLGKGLVHLLTNVIGKSLGLVLKGILQGVGNSLQESRYRNDREQQK